MIYFNEDMNGWCFDQVTDLEKSKIYDLGKDRFIEALSNALFRQMMEQDALAKIDDEEFGHA
jgi:hypothetical protein